MMQKGNNNKKKERGRSTLFRTIKTELKKTLDSPATVIMMFAAAAACTLSVAYIDTDSRQRTVLSLLIEQDAELLLSDTRFQWMEMWRLGFGSWTYILFPLLLTGGYLHMLSEERSCGGTRFFLVREGRVPYCIGKTVSIMISGGVILLGGYLIYGLITVLGFPGFSLHSLTDITVAGYILCRLGRTFLYGMMVGIFGYLVSVYCTEKYIVLCFPMMLSYVYSSVYDRIEQQLIAGEKWKLQEYFQIFRISNLVDGVDMKSRLCTLLCVLVWYLLGMLLFIHRIRKEAA